MCPYSRITFWLWVKALGGSCPQRSQNERISSATSTTTVYTDGACLGNPGPGGWGWVVPDGRWANGADTATTNQRMELTAVLEALRAIEGPVEVVSDSTYVVNCFRDRWWAGWLKRDWRNSNKQPVANRDIWEPLIELYRSAPHEITFTWVKGHAGDEWNEVADRLAAEASRTQVGRTGVGMPDDLAEADEIGPLAARDGTADNRPFGSSWRPAGRCVAVLGLQLDSEGPHSDSDVDKTRQRLAEILAAKKELDDDLVVLTGLRRGAETLGAEAAAEAGVPYVAVLPYPNPARKWPSAKRNHFAQMLEGAAKVVCLQRKVPDTSKRAGEALKRRNAWLRKVADEALIVWDGADRRVGRVVSAFEREMPDDVWVVDA